MTSGFFPLSHGCVLGIGYRYSCFIVLYTLSAQYLLSCLAYVRLRTPPDVSVDRGMVCSSAGIFSTLYMIFFICYNGVTAGHKVSPIGGLHMDTDVKEYVSY